MKFLTNIIKYLQESKTELKKVKWISRQETVQYVIIVIVISLAVAIYLGGLDYLFSLFLRKIILR